MIKTLRIYILFLVASLLFSATAHARIEWRVENPFRMFLNAEHVDIHRDAFVQLTDEERQTPILSAERILAKRYPGGWAQNSYNQTCWTPSTNNYKACKGERRDYIYPAHHSVIARLRGSDRDYETCEWHVLPISRSKAVRHKYFQKIRSDCSRPVKLKIPYKGGASVKVMVRGTSLGETKIKIRDVFIVGIGDSFASGEGNPDKPVSFSSTRATSYGNDPSGNELSGYPSRVGDWRNIGDGLFRDKSAQWLNKPCHRSLYSYQLRVALQLAIEDPHRAVTFAGYSCAGSEVTWGLFKLYKGTDWDKHYTTLPQISAIADDLCDREPATEKIYTSAYTQRGTIPEFENIILSKCYKPRRKIDLILVSIGGNDVGFSRLLANAFFANKSLLKKVGGWMGSIYDTAEAGTKLNGLKQRYAALNKALHYILGISWKQSDRIILTAYPRIALSEDGKSYCPKGSRGMSVYPHFSIDEQRLIEGSRFAGVLNKHMRGAARRHRWTFVDGHRNVFAKHGFCAVDRYNVEGDAEQLSIPRLVDGVWKPYNPADYKPYASRQRWYRTPNDSYMTAHFHAAGSVLKKVLRRKRLKWFQVVLAGTYSGAFHPTAEGHAAIADAVLPKASRILAKYRKPGS